MRIFLTFALFISTGACSRVELSSFDSCQSISQGNGLPVSSEKLKKFKSVLDEKLNSAGLYFYTDKQNQMAINTRAADGSFAIYILPNFGEYGTIVAYASKDIDHSKFLSEVNSLVLSEFESADYSIRECSDIYPEFYIGGAD